MQKTVQVVVIVPVEVDGPDDEACETVALRAAMQFVNGLITGDERNHRQARDGRYIGNEIKIEANYGELTLEPALQWPVAHVSLDLSRVVSTRTRD